jgi:hypothetical protein
MFDDDTFDELDEFFSGGGGPKGYSWDGAKVGQFVTGIIYDMEVRDKVNMETKEIELNEWGKSKKVLVLSVLTDLRDEEIEDDDGTRRLFLQGNALFEFKKTLREMKVRKPLKGGRVKQTLIGKRKTNYPKPQNLFEMLYAEPTGDTISAVSSLVAAKVTAANKVDDDPWAAGASASSTTAATGGASTLDSMRKSKNTFTDDSPPF